jgi:transposase-like protein
MVKNLKDLMNKYRDEAACREMLIQQRWNGKPSCPYCKHPKAYSIEKGKRFKCANNQCYKKFSVTVGTIFEASNIPLTTWFPAMYLISAHKKGISSVQLAKDLGVTQKTAWFMLHRIRESLKEKGSPLLSGIVESDETYMARKYASDFKGLSPEQVEHIQKNKHSHSRKGAVLGLAERETGKVIITAFDNNRAENIRPLIKKHVLPGSELHTDESYLYSRGLDEYTRKAVPHAKRQWVIGNVHTNTVENFWSVMRRGVYGIYHQISFKHLQAYCDEFSYRYNTREISDGHRFVLTLQQVEGRLSYKRLVHGKGKENSGEGQETTQKEG